MLHARNDYNRRIQDSKSIIPDDEPVFLLRGQDEFAPIILEMYAILVQNAALHDENIVRNTKAHAAAMRKWQEEEGRKNPDMKESESVY